MTDEVLRTVRRYLRHKRNEHLGGAIMFAIIAALVGMLRLFPISMTDGARTAVLWSAILLALIGVCFFGVAVSRWRIESQPLWRLLTEHPEHIVWIHDGLEVVSRLYGAEVARGRHVFFLTTDPTWNRSVVLRPAEAAAFLDDLRVALPDVVFGHTPARVARYRENPAAFGAAPDV